MERYSSYKDSGVKWLGEIPGHWEVRRLGGFFSERRTKVSDTDFAALSVTKNGIFPQLENVAKTQDGDNRKLVRAGDFVINSRSDRKGSSGVSPLDGSVSLINIVLVPREGVEPSFCNYLLKTNDFIEEFYRNGRGIVADLWTTHYDEMKLIKVAFPPLSEQRAMSAYLDRATAQLDAAIAREQQMIDLLNERKRIIIQQAVTKGLDPNAKLKPSGVEWIGEVPEGWEVKRLKAASLSLTKGNGITKDEVFIDGDIPCVRYGEIYSKYNNSFVECLSKTKEGQIKSPRYFEHGDILFAGTGELVAEIGKSIVYMGHEKCMAGGDIIVMKHANNPVFMNYALNAQYAQDQKSYSKAKLKVVHISASEIGNVMLAIPPYGEQQAIATFLDEISEKINKAIKRSNALISLIQERKQILISEVVTGKIKVS